MDIVQSKLFLCYHTYMSDLPGQPLAGNLKSTPPAATNPNQTVGLNNSGLQQSAGPASGFGKEKELLPQSEAPLLEEIKTDLELSPELEKAGLERRSETIHLPQDLQNMGVTAHGPAQPVSQQAATIALPLTDDQIDLALHQKIWSNIRWLGEWCVRQLRKAHFHLKKISGKVVRERDT